MSEGTASSVAPGEPAVNERNRQSVMAATQRAAVQPGGSVSMARNGVRPMDLKSYAGAVLAVLSFALVVLSRRQLGTSFSVAPKATELVTHGLYSRLQNPMYVFVDLTIVGVALAWHQWYVLLVLLVLVPLQIRNASRERALLLQKFGDTYEVYRRTTWF